MDHRTCHAPVWPSARGISARGISARGISARGISARGMVNSDSYITWTQGNFFDRIGTITRHLAAKFSGANPRHPLIAARACGVVGKPVLVVRF